MLVRDAIGRFLVERGVRTFFGVVGSGNFHVTNAMVSAGARFIAARHEGGATTMADAYARLSGEVGVVTLHQGCGYTNALTGLTEASKSHTPMLLITAEATDERSNFFIDQGSVARGLGAAATRVRSAETALEDVARAYALARNGRRAVVLNVPIDVQDQELTGERNPEVPARLGEPRPDDDDIARFVELLLTAERPVFVVGRGGRSAEARDAVADLAARCGALLATSAVARGLFNEEAWGIDVSGGFSSPLTAELIGQADLIVGFGCMLNMWTMRHGKLIADGTKVVQVDIDPMAIGRNRPVELGLWGGAAETAKAASAHLDRGGMPARTGYRTDEVAQRIRDDLRWSQTETPDVSTAERIDPRVLSRELNGLLPGERVLAVDSGNFLGYASMYLDVPDENGFCFTQAFQSVGLGLATAIGAAIAQPERLPIAACGDGGFLMGISELETVVRLGLPMLVVVYNDAMYGAEVHHFGPDGDPLDIVTFPDSDLASIASGHGCDAITVRSVEDLTPVKDWLSSGPSRPLVIDAKVVSDTGSWWLQEAFGH
jgi:thiamine pyrophosphate-dependent acetolactate synthase large subunit-like protein